jgi:hypothetical protein
MMDTQVFNSIKFALEVTEQAGLFPFEACQYTLNEEVNPTTILSCCAEFDE